MRLFVAINFDEVLKDRLAACAERLRELAPSCRPTRRENLHLTLCFLGELSPSRIKDVKLAMEEAAGGVPAFDLRLGGAGRFRRGGGGDVWWAGVENAPPLPALQRKLSDALRARGFALEEREFSPHLTLAREVVPKTPIDPEAVAPSGLSQRVAGIELMHSDRVRGVLTYTPLVSVPLRGE